MTAPSAGVPNNFFDDGSPYLSHPLLTPERTAAEVDLILEHALRRAPSRPATALDVGCGFGRHSLELAARGIAAVGVDPSQTMIDHARASAITAGHDVDFRVGTASTIAEENAFDLVICLFTTLGQQTEGSATAADADSELLTAAASASRPGATFVVELPERSRALDMLVTAESLGPTDVTRRFDESTGVVHERFAGPAGTFDLSYRLYAADEVTTMLSKAGFDHIEVMPTALVPPPPTFMTLYATA